MPSAASLYLLAFASPWVAASAPCAVKAWVRADDLAPNTVSHGEVKVKLVQPCAHAVQSVTLRLGLDEYAEESLISNETAPSSSGKDVEDLWDRLRDAGAPTIEWTTTAHRRTAWITEHSFALEHASGELQDSEWVLPFSVLSPNVNFPAAITPLLMRRSTAEWTQMFGRSYRYTALVTFSGSNETVNIPAGFTAFMPTSHASESLAAPREVTVEASGDAIYDLARGKCALGGEADSSVENTMRLRVLLPRGGIFVQGQQTRVNVTLLSGGDNMSSTDRTSSTNVERFLAPNWAASPRGGAPDFLYLREISAQMWRTPAEPSSGYGTPLSELAPINVPDYVPCTTPTGPDAPLRVEAYLSITITERRRAPHLDPLRDYWNGVPTVIEGRHSTSVDTEVERGWQFGPCDEWRHHEYRYTARVPVTIVSARYSDAISYLDNDGRVPMPRIVSGHLAAPEGGRDAEFAIADPISVRETRKVVTQVRGSGFGSIWAIDTKAGDYVGALWQSRLYNSAEDGMPFANPVQTVLVPK
ncbi:hypothetical protein AURDEDRAFT_185672 [Auricularia subglabra TFB-10046 SS5]|nr:hypothetical protein AURDEDRAFT_185672 [Auricularia subglabra TFB-10046 SS5]